MNARTILAEKGGGVRSITPDALVFAALEAMAEHKVGALMVVEGRTLPCAHAKGFDHSATRAIDRSGTVIKTVPHATAWGPS